MNSFIGSTKLGLYLNVYIPFSSLSESLFINVHSSVNMNHKKKPFTFSIYGYFVNIWLLFL